MSDLKARLRRVEDLLAIQDLITRYGPAVDARDRGAVAEIWDAGGEYRFDQTTLRGDAVPALVDIDAHRGFVEHGCGHLLTPPRVRLDGDRATAVNHSMLVLRDGSHWRVERLAANRWEFARTAAGWRVRSRTNALLDGDPTAPRLFSAAGDAP